VSDLRDSYNKVFRIESSQEFNEICLEVFQLQAKENPVYSEYLEKLDFDPSTVSKIDEIPFLPIELFKSHKVSTGPRMASSIEFTSSGTTGSTPSRHVVQDPAVYEKSFTSAFERFYGSPSDYRILALLPSYLEREGSSLIYMTDRLISMSNHPESGFFLDNTDRLRSLLNTESLRKTLLIGVSYALLDLVEEEKIDAPDLIVMETGGMKGRRKEMTRMELHRRLRSGFGVEYIHSEYGMTELLSQAYANKNGLFRSPPWMRVSIREIQDPFTSADTGKTGAINVIDLANIHSCSFLATSDLGKINPDGTFEVLGRMDYSEMRGCNLMVAVD